MKGFATFLGVLAFPAILIGVIQIIGAMITAAAGNDAGRSLTEGTQTLLVGLVVGGPFLWLVYKREV